MLDISEGRGDPSKVMVYMDGLDARIFKILVSRLGSEQKVQNALILLGLIEKARTTGSGVTQAIVQSAKKAFEEDVGMCYADFEKMMGEL